MLDTLYTSCVASVGLFKARPLPTRPRSREARIHIRREPDELSRRRRSALRTSGIFPTTSMPGITSLGRKACAVPEARQRGHPPIRAALSRDFAMFGAGGLMGFRAAGSMLIGMILNF